MVFHNDLKENYLKNSIERACKLDFYFAHMYYFYISSLEKIVSKYEIQTLKKVATYKEYFLNVMSAAYADQSLNSLEYYTLKKTLYSPTDNDVVYSIRTYGTDKEVNDKKRKKAFAEDIPLDIYTSVFQEQPENYSFQSNITFFEDLFRISDQLKTATDKKTTLIDLLKLVNERLPATVYIPFSKSSHDLI